MTLLHRTLMRGWGHSPVGMIALATWAWWAPLITWQDRWGDFVHHFPMTLTMVVGSFIAGATSEGGGAVAFPVLTLVFGVAPSIARDFALMIQSVGMTAAAVAIIRARIPVAWAAVAPVSLGGALGLVGGLTWLSPLMPPALVKIFFCCLWLSFAVALHLISLRGSAGQTDDFRPGECGLPVPALFGIGLLGGVISSLVGSGIDILTFAFLTLHSRLNERVATPTSVILMAVNAVVGFSWQGAVRGVIDPQAWSFWYVCVPVVVLGAPLGAWFIRNRSSAFIRRLLYVCIWAQFIGAVLILPFSPSLFLVGSSTFAAGSLLFVLLGRRGARRLQERVRSQEADPLVATSRRGDPCPDPGT
ncbi:MAG: sulfite exporter TauE/SafE family protein [bacterium]